MTDAPSCPDCGAVLPESATRTRRRYCPPCASRRQSHDNKRRLPGERSMTPAEVDAYLDAASAREWRLLPAWEAQR